MHMMAVFLLFPVLTDVAMGSNYLDITGIRLVNGTGPFGGRVEVSIDGVWGTVCDDSFDMNDAKVMCGMMNLQATAYVTGAFYGQGMGPLFAQEFICNGYEQHIKDCEFVANVLCTHAMDISIVCTECGEIKISNGYAQSISEDGRVLTSACRSGFRSIVNTSVCEAWTWSVPSIYCGTDISDIRLVNGIGLYDGRVELLKNGTWGTICGTSFSWSEAEAICNILFDTTLSGTYYTSSNYYGAGTGPIYIDNLDCEGTEVDINECTYSLNVSCTDHNGDVAVACEVPLNITNTRLVNGTGPYDGRIELYVDGYWGTIDRRYVDMYAAKTICNTHGASLAIYFDTAIYGEGSGPIVIDAMICFNEQDTIDNCIMTAPYRPDSSHSYDLSTACTPCGLPDIYNGDPVAFKGSELTVSCHTEFHPNQVKMKCLTDKSWSEDQRCTPIYGFPLDITGVRLADGPSPTNGRVELKSLNTWGTVCDDSFGMNEANAICSMLGYSPAVQYYQGAFYGPGTGPIFVDDLSCEVDATHINNCTYSKNDDCYHDEDVSVVCTDCSTTTNCSGCKSGYWGEACQLSCPSNCVNLTCGKQSGDCDFPCAPGYWGTKCNFSCSTNCKAGTCNRTTGVCNDGCEINYYGGQCNMTCASTCLQADGGRRCFYTNGSCVKDCQNGYYGDMCQDHCSENCINIICSRTSGGCKFGCVGGFEGKDCTKSKPGVIVNYENTADDSNVSLIIGVGVGSVAASILVVAIVIIVRHLRHRHQRRHTPAENTHELTDVQQGNVRTIQESLYIQPVADSDYVNTTSPVYEQITDNNIDSYIYARIGGINVS